MCNYSTKIFIIKKYLLFMTYKVSSESYLIELKLFDNKPLFYTINSYRKYSTFFVVNPFACSEQSWYNISEEIGNNKFTLSSGDKETEVILRDGWYANSDSYKGILQQIVDGFKKIGEDVTIKLDNLTNKLDIKSVSDKLKGILFTKKTASSKESSNSILGFSVDKIGFTSDVFSTKAVDLFSDGRFFLAKIRLNNFSSSSYTNEPQTLITLTNQSEFGKYIENQNITFEKNLFQTGNVLNLTFDVVDNNNLPLKIQAPITVQFQIKCYNRIDDQAVIQQNQIL